MSVIPTNQEPGPSSTVNDDLTEHLSQLSVLQLREQIKSKKIQVKGLAKLRKSELINYFNSEILNSDCQQPNNW